QESVALYDRVERVRATTKQRRASAVDTAAGFDELAAELAGLPVADALPLARAFAHFLNLANIAEQQHRVRRRRAYQRDPKARPQPASIEEAIPRLLSGGVTPGALHAARCA